MLGAPFAPCAEPPVAWFAARDSGVAFTTAAERGGLAVEAGAAEAEKAGEWSSGVEKSESGS